MAAPSASSKAAAYPSACPMSAEASAAASLPSACPMASSGLGASASSCSSTPAAAGEVLDPRNMMPSLPQTPAANQSVALSKDRETSSIPKADEAGNWVYPSPQQFYHALLRKNKEAEAESMDAVVKVHNVTNERTWDAIMEWERLHPSCKFPKLVRFVGRSEDLSLGASWSKRLSYRGEPFDRHDWYVDRCGQKVVRYVIDYYDDPLSKERDQLDITIDARPALDSAGAWVDRLRRPGWQLERMRSALFGSR